MQELKVNLAPSVLYLLARWVGDKGTIKTMYRSNIYYQLRFRHYKRQFEKLSPFILIIFAGFALWFALAVAQIATVPVVVNILR